MATEIQLRPGVVFRTDAAGAGSIEFPKGRRFDNISFFGTLPGTTEDGMTIYGPPYAGIVTSATWLGQWRAFGQRVEDDTTIRQVPIKFQRIAPAARRRWRAAPAGQRATTLHGSVVITNDHGLAGEACSFSPDFAEVRAHDFDRTLME